MIHSRVHGAFVLLLLAGFINGTVQAGPWWDEPIVKYKVPVQSGQPHYLNKDESDQYLFYPSHTTETSALNYLFSIKTLTEAKFADDVTPIFSFTSASFHNVGCKGGAVSDDLGRIISSVPGAGGINSLPIDAPWIKDVTVFAITNTATDAQFDGPDFSHDSAYLYAANYKSGQQHQIYKFNVVEIAQAGYGITFNAVYNTGVSRVRSVNAYFIGGKDLLYYGEGVKTTSAKVCVFDTVSEAETVLVDGATDGSITSEIMNVKVSGVGVGGQMYLYVQCENGALNIYELGADGMSIGALVRSFTRAQMYALLGAAPATNMRCFEVTDDGSHAFITFHGANFLNVLWTLPPPPITPKKMLIMIQ